MTDFKNNTDINCCCSPESGAKNNFCMMSRLANVSEMWFDPILTLPNVDILLARQWPEKNGLEYAEEKSTLVIDLTKPLSTIFDAFKRDTKYLIRRCDTRDGMEFKIISNPSALDVKHFADFYNLFASQKSLPHIYIKYLIAAAEAGMLTLSWAYLDDEPLVAHSYVVASSRVRLLQSASLFRSNSDSAHRSLVGRTNRWLHWKDMGLFVENGYKIYDFGGWYSGTEDKERLKINSFKEEFGGVLDIGFDGVIILTLRGKLYKLIQSCNNWIKGFVPESTINISKNIKSLGRVLVLGTDTRSFLSTVRSFGRAGFKVDVGWVDYRNPALLSRYIQEIVTIPEYSLDSKAWLDEINRLVRERDYDFVVGCHDPQVLPLQLHRSELEQEERFALIPDKAFQVCFNKKLTYDLAYGLGIPVPEQFIAHSQDIISSKMLEWNSDIYIKPLRSTNIENIAHRNNVIRVNGLAEIPSFNDNSLREGLLVQCAVSGRGIGIELLAKEGKILTAFQHERVHEPPIGGGSSYRRSVSLNEGMLEASRMLMQALEYTGVAMVEFKQCTQSGKWWLMEINGRFWGSLPLTVAAGLDMPIYWYQMLRQGREEFPQKYQKNIFCRSWQADRYWFSQNSTARRTNKRLLTVPQLSILAEVRHVMLGRERCDTLVWDDPQPVLAELKQLIIEPIDKRLRSINFMRYFARVKAERAVALAHSLLFVCYGNICRSPFAEKIAQLEMNISVNSAGTHPQAGRYSPPEAIQAALKFGIDLGVHRSRALDKSMIDSACVVFVFDLRNERDVLAKFPFARSKVHQIACLDDGEFDVSDPFGNDDDAFDLCYNRLTNLVHRIIHLIRKGK